MKTLTLCALAIAGALAGGPAWAEKPDGAGRPGKAHKEDKQAGKGKGKDKDRQGAQVVAAQEGKGGGKPRKAKDARDDVRVGAFFSDQHRLVARSYYTQHYGGPKACPPGLAKKNNGCMPPGQAKKWAVGQPLPASVTVYPVPHAVLVQLPPPPAGYRYVRVATDILLIAVGTQLVVDAISDLMRL